jgi:DNA-directed RNA polymerase subunit RPC12/RpoP
VHERGICPVCDEEFPVVFTQPDEEVDCPHCGFKVPVPDWVVEKVKTILRAVENWRRMVDQVERRPA